jgi:hypothetical protein
LIDAGAQPVGATVASQGRIHIGSFYASGVIIGSSSLKQVPTDIFGDTTVHGKCVFSFFFTLQI